MDIRKYILEKDRELYKSNWHHIQVTKDGFEYDEGKEGVAILPYRYPVNSDIEFLIRKEHSVIQPDKPATVITGRKDPGESPMQTAIRELKEESGYSSPARNFLEMGKMYISKGSPTQDVFFCVDLTGIPQGEIETDGTSSEALSSNIWVSQESIKKYVKNSRCVYLNTAYSKWLEKQS